LIPGLWGVGGFKRFRDFRSTPTRTSESLSMSNRTARWKRPEIRFQTASEDVVEGELSKEDRGEAVVSFYRTVTGNLTTSTSDVIIIDSPPEESVEEICPVCRLPLPLSARLRRKHLSTTAHLVKVVDVPSPVNPLPIDRKSYGYRVLSSQGWSDKERHGVGAEDNKGRREPVKATRVKNDTVGLGIKGKKVQQVIKEKKSIQSGKDIREAYEKEKHIRRDIMTYLNQ
jgi:hypothetical protein